MTENPQKLLAIFGALALVLAVGTVIAIEGGFSGTTTQKPGSELRPEEPGVASVVDDLHKLLEATVQELEKRCRSELGEGWQDCGDVAVHLSVTPAGTSEPTSVARALSLQHLRDVNLQLASWTRVAGSSQHPDDPNATDWIDEGRGVKATTVIGADAFELFVSRLDDEDASLRRIQGNLGDR